jgi:hypothetical protein
MVSKTITIILHLGLITQIFAFDANTIELLRGPVTALILFCGAPVILAIIIVIVVKIIKHAGILILDLFKTEEE